MTPKAWRADGYTGDNCTCILVSFLECIELHAPLNDSLLFESVDVIKLSSNA